ncbi:hypothetical protein AY578_09630 [Streptomyces thermocarboxydus]|nr:hypothetical protein AY578_09630 [Streptomyces thermocarboxydus]
MGCSCDDRPTGDLPLCDAVIDLARHLHADGVIERVLGRPLPVVVFDMARPGWEAHATEAANPPELIVDFKAWLQAVGEV